jgi:hypothetical protein
MFYKVFVVYYGTSVVLYQGFVEFYGTLVEYH